MHLYGPLPPTPARLRTSRQRETIVTVSTRTRTIPQPAIDVVLLALTVVIAAVAAVIVHATLTGPLSTPEREAPEPVGTVRATAVGAQDTGAQLPSCDYPGQDVAGVPEDVWSAPLHCERPLAGTAPMPITLGRPTADDGTVWVRDYAAWRLTLTDGDPGTYPSRAVTGPTY